MNYRNEWLKAVTATKQPQKEITVYFTGRNSGINYPATMLDVFKEDEQVKYITDHEYGDIIYEREEN